MHLQMPGQGTQMGLSPGVFSVLGRPSAPDCRGAMPHHWMTTVRLLRGFRPENPSE